MTSCYEKLRELFACLSGIYLSAQTQNQLVVDTSRGETLQINVRRKSTFHLQISLICSPIIIVRLLIDLKASFSWECQQERLMALYNLVLKVANVMILLEVED